MDVPALGGGRGGAQGGARGGGGLALRGTWQKSFVISGGHTSLESKLKYVIGGTAPHSVLVLATSCVVDDGASTLVSSHLPAASSVKQLAVELVPNA